MSRRNRKRRTAGNTKSTRQRRRKKSSKLVAAIVIEIVSAVALFSAYRFARDVRNTNAPRTSATIASPFLNLHSHQSGTQPNMHPLGSAPASHSHAEPMFSRERVANLPSADQQPVFRVPDFSVFRLGDS